MKKIFISVCSLLPVFLLSGCKEDGLLLNINPDGSGTAVIRSFMNSAAMNSMTSGFGGGDAGGAIEGPDPIKEARNEVEVIAAAMGGLTLVSGKEAKNKAGWPGYVGVYSFADVNKVRITLNKPDSDAEESDGTDNPEYTVKFTPGSPARLEINAEIDPKKDEEAAARSDQEVQMEAKQMQMQAGMMGPMLAGMRSTIMVRVNGTVTESNADITSPAGNNTFILADMKLAEALSDPVVSQMMIETKGAMPDRSINTKAIKLQNPRAPVVVTFQ